jgi:hypothetical protein
MMAGAASSSFQSPIALRFPDCFIGGKLGSLKLDTDGNPLTPEEQRVQIKRSLSFIKAATWFSRFSQPSPAAGNKRHRQESLPPLTCMFAEYSPRVPVRVMFDFTATACQRLATAPGNKRVTEKMTWAGTELMIDRVTRGLVRKVQVRCILCKRTWHALPVGLTRPAANARLFPGTWLHFASIS